MSLQMLIWSMWQFQQEGRSLIMRQNGKLSSHRMCLTGLSDLWSPVQMSSSPALWRFILCVWSFNVYHLHFWHFVYVADVYALQSFMKAFTTNVTHTEQKLMDVSPWSWATTKEVDKQSLLKVHLLLFRGVQVHHGKEWGVDSEERARECDS